MKHSEREEARKLAQHFKARQATGKSEVGTDVEEVLGRHNALYLSRLPKGAPGIVYEPDPERKRHLLYERNARGKPVGFLEFAMGSPVTGLSLYVDPKVRRTGVATRLVNAAEQRTPATRVALARYAKGTPQTTGCVAIAGAVTTAVFLGA